MRLFALVLLLAACGSRSPRTIDGAVPGATTRCTGRAFEPPSERGWKHKRHHVTSQMAARHYAQDVIAPPGAAIAFTARFMYGPTLKDLEDETVRAFVDDCTGWVEVGTATTDDEGVAGFAIDLALSEGSHEVRVVVDGDRTQATAVLWVLPAGARIVITDVDGTMTTDDGQLFQQILDGDHVPIAYEAGAALTRAHVEAGHVVVYLTGRPYWLLGHTRTWLADLGFAPGPVHVADSHTQILPTEDSVGAYKLAWLAALIAKGYVVEVAYGNAATDVFAYLGAGIPAERVWIIGEHAGARGTHAASGSWSERLVDVR